MPPYICAFAPGSSSFFTVTLPERGGKLMMLKAGGAALSGPCRAAKQLCPYLNFPGEW
jgi:hypothetical protein